MDVERYKGLLSTAQKASMVFAVLEDRQWHCRNHEYGHVGSGQLAGSGGIQGLKRGGSKRPGIKIESKNDYCTKCKMTAMHDRWTGNWTHSVHAHTVSETMELRILSYFHRKDVVEQTTRSVTDLTIDHKFPMSRWPDNYGDKDKEDMSDEDIRDRFQLLKKSNGTISHNRLKSEACVKCVKTGKRGTPFGIKYFYEGDGDWHGDKTDEHGCHGCGWYDFDKWRKSLNRELRERDKIVPD